MNRWTKWLAALVLVLTVLVLPLGQSASVAFAETAAATLVVIGDEGHKVMVCPKQVELQENDTALDVLKNGVGTENVETQDSSYGPLLTRIQDLQAGDGGPGSYWGFRINDVEASEGAGSYVVKAGDIIEFRYALNWPPDDTPVNELLKELGGCSTDTTNPTPLPTPTPQPAPAVDTKQALHSAAAYVQKKGVESDWEMIGLVRSGITLPADFKASYLQSLETYVKNANRLQNTDLARTILAVTAAGGYADQFAGQDLVAKLYNDASIANMNSANAYAYALLALNSRDYEIPGDAKWTREALVQHILQLQHTDGGWAFMGEMNEPGDVDMTGMVMTALAAMQESKGVQGALEKAKKFLRDNQTDNGGYGYAGVDNPNSTAQAIMGLTAIGIDPAAAEFTKNGRNALQSLGSFQLPSGGFSWKQGDTAVNSMATEQALYALVQYQFFQDEKGSIFHWVMDPAPQPEPEQPEPEQPTQPDTEPPVTGTPEQDEQEPNEPAPAAEATNETVETVKGQKLPDTAMFGTAEVATAAAGIVLMTAGAVMWRRKKAA